MIVKLLRLFALALVLSPAMAAAEPIKLKLAFFTSDRSNIYQFAIKPFVEAVNSEGKDLIEIEVFFSGAISQVQTQQNQLIADGTADMAVVVAGYQPEQFPDSAVMELPGLFRDEQEASQVYTRLIEAGRLEGYKDYFLINAFVSAGESIHSRKQINSLADLQGQTIRTNNKIETSTLQRLGAIPVVIPINRTTDAISQGKIDGATVPPAMLFEFGIGRVTSHHYMLRLGGAPVALLMNRKKFESLPAPAQAIIRKYSGEQLSARTSAAFQAKNLEILRQLEADPRRQVVFPSRSDLAASQRVFNDVIEEWAALRPQNRKLLGLVREEMAKLEAADEGRQ